MKAAIPFLGIVVVVVFGLAFPRLGLAEPATKPDAGKPPGALPAPAAVAPSASPPATPPEKIEPPKRAKVTSAQYRAIAEENAKHAAFDTRLKAGSWGHIPPELRKLPRRSKFCGVDSMGQAVIASPLYGKDIEDHYTPLFTKVDFNPLKCEIKGTQTHCHTKRHRDIGIIVTDANNEAYVLSIIRRGPPRPLSQTGHDR